MFSELLSADLMSFLVDITMSSSEAVACFFLSLFLLKQPSGKTDESFEGVSSGSMRL